MDAIETVDIVKCPECESYNYLSYEELYEIDDEWISLKCQCLSCKTLFQINYRAVCIDIIGPNREQREIKRKLRKIFSDLLRRNRDLRMKYDNLVNSQCDENMLNETIKYLLNKYPIAFSDKSLPTGKEKEEYLADVIQVLCAVDA